MTNQNDWKHYYSGKVRDLYIPLGAKDPATSAKMLIVASDRISAFDRVLQPEIQGKGDILTSLSLWWFSELSDIPNHLADEAPPAEFLRNSMVVLPLRMFPVECIVRGYMAGSAWTEYQREGTIGGISLPKGLKEGEILPQPIFTPTTKAHIGGSDQPLSFEQMKRLVGSKTASQIRTLSYEIYRFAHQKVGASGLILADTKLEFGLDPTTNQIALADEVLTPDSSRYWDIETYSTRDDRKPEGLDKQLVRDWLAKNWDRKGAPPNLPRNIVDNTKTKYLEIFERIVNRGFS